MKFYLLLLSFLFLLPNFFNTHLIKVAQKPVKKERFENSLAKRIRNVNDLENYTDSLAARRHISDTSVNYAKLILETVEYRFYHGYSHYTLKEDWIAALAGKFLWYDLSAIVIPDDLLKYPMAACSQQSIVIMALLKNKHIPYRRIEWAHHYTLEAQFNKRWVYLDPDLEADIDFKNPGLDFLITGNHLAERYKNRLTDNDIAFLLKHPKTTTIKLNPAPNASLFHTVTRIISHWLWTVPFLIFLLSFKKFSWYKNNKAVASNTYTF